MSYKNPKIIDDKSGLIVSQAMERASGTVAQGIVAFGAEEKRREEVLKRENEKRDAVFVGLANEMAENSALFDTELEKGGSELRNVLIPRNEGLLKEINSIDIEQQINGNKDPRLAKRRSDLVRQISNGNTFAKSYIETASNLTEIMKDPQAFLIGQKTYVERGGSKEESEAILLATGGSSDFVTSFGDDLSITITNKRTKQSFKNSREQFESKSKNLFITKDYNTAVVETKSLRDSIYNEDGTISYQLLKEMPPPQIKPLKEIPGYITNYSIQEVNKEFVSNLQTENIDKTLAAINSYTSKQKQALFLKDIGITGDKLKKYQDGDNTIRRGLIKTSSDLIFKSNSGITKIEGTENYIIKTQIGNPIAITSSKPTQAQVTDNTFVSKTGALDPTRYLMQDTADFDIAFKSTYPPPQMYNNNEVVGLVSTDGGFQIKMKVPKVKAEPKVVGATELDAVIASNKEKYGDKKFGDLNEGQQAEVRDLATNAALTAALFANTDGQTEEVLSPVFLYQNSTHMKEYMSLTASSKGTPTLTGYTNAANNIGDYFTTISNSSQ